MALPYKIATLLYCFNERGRNPAARTRAGAEPRLLEPVRRQAENGHRRVALRLRLPRGGGGIGNQTRRFGFASDRHGQRTRLSGPDPLADVPVRGEEETGRAAAAARGGAVSIFPARSRSPACTFRRRTASKFGRGSGNSAAAFSRRTAIATRTGATIGRWRR